MKVDDTIIVSMTSWHKRIENVKPVLESILHQTVMPNKILLNLCTEDFPNMEEDLPLDLLNFIKEHQDLIEIYWFIENYKAWKKHLHVLDIAEENDVIMSIDDDMIYPADYIEKMYMSFLHFGKKFPITNFTEYLFHNLWNTTGSQFLYTKSLLGADYKKYLTSDVLHNSYEDIILTIMFATHDVMIMPNIYKLSKDLILYNCVSPFSDITHSNDREYIDNMMANTLLSLEDSFNSRYFPQGYKFNVRPHFWEILVKMVNANRKYCSKYPQVKYAVEVFDSNLYSGTPHKVDRTASELDQSPEKIIITMSSWHKRFDNIYNVLQTILNNTIQPDEILLNFAIDDLSSYPLPTKLEELINSNDKIKVSLIEDSAIKSWKKHYSILTRHLYNDNDIIISIDDDVLYKSTFIDTMVKSFRFYGKKYPISTFTDCFCQGGFALCGHSFLYTPKFFKDFEKYMTPEIFHMFPEDNHLLNILNINRCPIMPVIGKNYLFENLHYNEADSNFGNDQFDDNWWKSYHEIMNESERIIANSCKDRDEMKRGWKPLCYNFSLANLERFLIEEKDRKDEDIFCYVYQSVKTHLEKNPGKPGELTNLSDKIDNIILN